MDKTYVKVGGVWRYVYPAVDQYRQVIDVLVSKRRGGEAARRFFRRALTALRVSPTEVVTDAAPTYPQVLDELVPAAGAVALRVSGHGPPSTGAAVRSLCEFGERGGDS